MGLKVRHRRELLGSDYETPANSLAHRELFSGRRHKDPIAFMCTHVFIVHPHVSDTVRPSECRGEYDRHSP